MTAKIDTSDITRAILGLRRVTAGGLQKELVRNLHDAAPKIVAEMKSSAHTKIQRRAASTVGASRDSKGVTLYGGRGSGLGATLFAGGEYGGRKSKKVFYSTRSRRGAAYMIHRRTTMQFLTHLGHEGYFFWPTLRGNWLPRLERTQIETLQKTVSGKS